MKKVRQGIQLDPSSVTKVIPNLEKYKCELLQIGGISPKNNLNEAKHDNRSIQKNWEPNEDMPICIRYLIELCKKDIEGSKGARVYYGSYMRKASTRLPPPTKDTISRFLFNIGSADKYVFDANVPNLDKIPSLAEMVKKKSGCDLPEKEIFISEDNMLQLGPATVSNYIVYVSSDPKIQKPATINTMNMHSTPKYLTLRVAKYHRVCIIIDILGTEDAVREASRQAETAIDQISKSDLQTIAKSLNPNANKDDEDKLTTREKVELQKVMKNVTSKQM